MIHFLNIQFYHHHRVSMFVTEYNNVVGLKANLEVLEKNVTKLREEGY
jgi:hypothetical protein